MYKPNLLFLCSRNQWRSPTAEKIWYKDPDWNVRSAGLSPRARKKVTIDDIRWADIIFVMERKHLSILKANFSRAVQAQEVVVLDIPDDYRYMDLDLVDILEDKVQAYMKHR